MWISVNMPPIILNRGTTWGVSSQHPDCFTPGKNPLGHTHRYEGRAGPSVGLDASEKDKFLSMPGILSSL